MKIKETFPQHQSIKEQKCSHLEEDFFYHNEIKHQILFFYLTQEVCEFIFSLWGLY